MGATSFGVAADFGHTLAAYSELLISGFSFYGFAAAVLNPHLDRTFVSVGKPVGIFRKEG